MSQNNLSSNLDGFVLITRLPNLNIIFLMSVVYMYAHKINLILKFLHVCRNCETALINCLVVQFVCGIVVFIILRLTGPNGPNATILEY